MLGKALDCFAGFRTLFPIPVVGREIFKDLNGSHILAMQPEVFLQNACIGVVQPTLDDLADLSQIFWVALIIATRYLDHRLPRHIVEEIVTVIVLRQEVSDISFLVIAE
jgi:energy-converting hydrogenase Eha subunit C